MRPILPLVAKPIEPFRLTPDLVLQACGLGYFPMSEDRHATEIFWVRPDMRGVLPIRGLKVSTSLARTVRRDLFEVRTDTAFRAVIEGCAATRTGREQTWINSEILDAYVGLHEAGHAHSVEAWRGEELVGGLYGVARGAAFFGESMFSFVSDASKVCLVHLTARLMAGGFVLHDTQFTTPHLKQFGARDVRAGDYARMLDAALKLPGDFFALDDQASGSFIVQSITQTS